MYLNVQEEINLDSPLSKAAETETYLKCLTIHICY